MEKKVVGFGFALFCAFFLLALIVRTEMAWGCLGGLAVILFGSYYWDA